MCLFSFVHVCADKVWLAKRGTRLPCRSSHKLFCRSGSKTPRWLVSSLPDALLFVLFFFFALKRVHQVCPVYVHAWWVCFFFYAIFSKKKKKNHKNHLFFHNCQSLKCFFFFNLHLNLFTFILYKCFHCSNLPKEDQKTPPKTCESLFFFSLATIIV